MDFSILLIRAHRNCNLLLPSAFSSWGNGETSSLNVPTALYLPVCLVMAYGICNVEMTVAANRTTHVNRLCKKVFFPNMATLHRVIVQLCTCNSCNFRSKLSPPFTLWPAAQWVNFLLYQLSVRCGWKKLIKSSATKKIDSMSRNLIWLILNNM